MRYEIFCSFFNTFLVRICLTHVTQNVEYLFVVSHFSRIVDVCLLMDTFYFFSFSTMPAMRKKKFQRARAGLSVLLTLCMAMGTYTAGRLLFAPGGVLAVNPITTVSPSNMNGWVQQQSGTATGSFVNGPASPPLGAGSFKFQVGSNGNDDVAIRTANHNNTTLSSITTLKYSTYVQQNTNCQAPYLLMSVDNDNNGTADDFLFFEPCYQNGAYQTQSGATVPNQCGVNTNCITLNTWQNWDALTGGWWSYNDNAGGPPLWTLARYAQVHPGSKIVGSSSGSGGLRITAGGGAGAWDNFVGYADALEFSAGQTAVAYDFEATQAASSSSMSSVSSQSSLSSSSGSSVSSLSSHSSLSSNSSSIACSLPTGLYGYWPFDENGGVIANEIVANRDGLLENGPTWVAGATQVSPNVSALSFDGSDDRVRVSTGASAFNFGTSNFTVSLFMKASSGQRGVLGNYSAAHKGWGLYVYSDGKLNFFGYGNQGVNDSAQTASVLNNQWHHIAGVYTRNGNNLTIDTYVDGVLVGTNTAGVGDITANSDLLFGQYIDQPNFQGSLDDIRIYNRALSANEIPQLANCSGGNNSSSMSSLSSASSQSSAASSVSSAASSISSSASSAASSISSAASSVSSAVSSVSSSISSVSSSLSSSIPSSSSSSLAAVPLCNGVAATIYVNGNGIIVGGPQNGQMYAGSLQGTSGPDVMVGTNGSDTIGGKAGNDTICGRDGGDILYGDADDDFINGEGANDIVIGGLGNDFLVGSAGNEILNGDDGNDIACAGPGTDMLNGNKGSDKLDGGPGSDMLDGGDGTDTCNDGTPFSCTVAPVPECSPYQQ